MTGPLCCLDTSPLIHAAERAYPVQVFPSFWEKLSDLVAAERVIAPCEMFVELEKKDDGDSFLWVKERRTMVVELDIDTQKIAREIPAEHPRLVDTKKGRDGADPFVIALAELRGAVVITQERPVGPRAKSQEPEDPRCL